MDQSKEVIELIMSIDDSNKFCVDCSADQVTDVSINNGVTLCESCATIHKAFGSEVSYIRKLTDEWDTYLYDYMVYGSNSRFINCLKACSIDNTMESNLKYKTVACDYYRRSLRAKVNKQKPVEDIDHAMGKNICETIEDSKEFEDYQLKEKLKINPLTKMQGFFVGKVGRTFDEMDLFGKIKEGSQKTWEGMKKGGQLIAEKTAPTTDKIKEGATDAFNQMKNAFTFQKTSSDNSA